MIARARVCVLDFLEDFFFFFFWGGGGGGGEGGGGDFVFNRFWTKLYKV